MTLVPKSLMPGSATAWKRRAVLFGHVCTVVGGVIAVALLARILLEAGRPLASEPASKAADHGREFATPLAPSPETTGSVRAESFDGVRSSRQPSIFRTTDRVPGAAPIITNFVPSRPRDAHELAIPRRSFETAMTEVADALEVAKAHGGIDGQSPVSSPGAERQPHPALPAPHPNRETMDSPLESKAVAALRQDTRPEVSKAMPNVSQATETAEKSIIGIGDGDRKPRQPNQRAHSRALRPSAPSQVAREQVKSERRDRKLLAAHRARNSAGPEHRVSAPPEVAAPPEGQPSETRVHLLGIPMPTGSEVKQCLFEFRC
jgi:hypothetical protein